MSVTQLMVNSSYGVTGYVTDGLVLHFDPGNSASYPGTGTTVTDITGSGRTATLTSGSQYETGDGGRFDFDGSEDMRCNINGLSTGKQAFSLEIWVNFTTYNTTYRWWLATLGNIASYNIHIIGRTSREYGIYNGVQFGGSIPTAAGNWQQIILTHDGAGNTMKLYENNSLIGTITNAGALSFNDTELYFGVTNGPTESKFQGKLGIVRLYNKALSSQEVFANYLNDRIRYGI